MGETVVTLLVAGVAQEVFEEKGEVEAQVGSHPVAVEKGLEYWG